MATPVNVAEFRLLAQKRLPRMVFDYLDGGAEDETGLARNIDAFKRHEIMPFKLRDVSRRSLDTQLFGRSMAAPFLLAPTGLNGAMWPEGDIALARAAAKAGIPFTLSTASNSTIEAVADKAGGDLWFQLYVIHRAIAEKLVARAEAAGCSTLVLTVDVGVQGKRERDLRNGFSMPLKVTPAIALDILEHPRWTWQTLRGGLPQLVNLKAADAEDTKAQAALLRRETDSSYDFEALKMLRDRWKRTLIVKGVMAPDDVKRCFALGVDGVVISNHGGRQLDYSPAPLAVLPQAVDAAQQKTVLLDGGIRRGSDIAKALAMGAKAVMLGRATLYGLAAAGEEGASAVIAMMKDELDQTLALAGCCSPAEFGPDRLRPAD